MSILKVCRLGHPVLREKSRTLPPAILETPAVQALIDNMIETMIEYHGVGLAAPQIHESLMLTVIESEGSRGKIPLTVLVNPVVTVLEGEMIEDWEGCLSIPDLRGRVARHSRLQVEALDREGKPMKFIAEGFFARVIQHEYDHLMGRVYLDRMADLRTLTHLEEMQRFWMPEAEPHEAEQ